MGGKGGAEAGVGDFSRQGEIYTLQGGRQVSRALGQLSRIDGIIKFVCVSPVCRVRDWTSQPTNVGEKVCRP